VLYYGVLALKLLAFSGLFALLATQYSRGFWLFVPLGGVARWRDHLRFLRRLDLAFTGASVHGGGTPGSRCSNQSASRSCTPPAIVAASCGRSGNADVTELRQRPGVVAHGLVIPTSNDGVTFSTGARLRASFVSRAPISAAVELPRTAASPFVVTSLHDLVGAFNVSVSAVGASSQPATVERGLVHYRDAFGPGTDVMHKVTPQGTEDYVRFNEAPQRSELRYRMVLSDRVAGLRLINNSLELLEESGTPRLRVNAPYGVDAAGKTFPAQLAVAGCAFDTSPAAPWDRAPTSPGATSCDVVVSWSATVAYPAVIDPAWTSTNNPAFPNSTYEDYLVRLSGGRALYAADNQAQLFDPATNTWATTGSPTFTFAHRTRLLAVGGNKAWAMENTGSSTSLYDPGTGTWTATSIQPIDNNGVALAYLGGNKVLVIAAYGNTFIYDVNADTYANRTGGGFIGANPGAFPYAPNKYVVGGLNYDNLAIYDVTNDKWSYSVPQIFGGSAATDCFNAEPLTNGTMLVYGECGAGNSAAIYDPAKDTVTPVAMPAAGPLACQCAHETGVAYGKLHYIGGGRFLYDEGTGVISDLGVFDSTAVNHGAIVKLLDGRSLAAGGSVGYDNGLADLLTATSSADCAIFGTPTTPVLDPVSKICKACDGDNGGATSRKCATAGAPACQTGAMNPLLGSCTECSAANVTLCKSTTPACDLTKGLCAACDAGFGVAAGARACPRAAAPACHGDGSCVVANGDRNTAATDPCPSDANPYVRADGTCGKCAANADCAGAAHAGPICNLGTGACGAPASDMDAGSGVTDGGKGGGTDAGGGKGGGTDAGATPDAGSENGATGNSGGCSAAGGEAPAGGMLLAAAVLTMIARRRRNSGQFTQTAATHSSSIASCAFRLSSCRPRASRA
jgi:MYXO-CTERM domain-containing protein